MTFVLLTKRVNEQYTAAYDSYIRNIHSLIIPRPLAHMHSGNNTTGNFSLKIASVYNIMFAVCMYQIKCNTISQILLFIHLYYAHVPLIIPM